MRRTPNRVIVLVLTWAAAVTAPGVAVAEGDAGQPPLVEEQLSFKEVVFSLTGEIVAGDYLRLYLQPGAIVTHSLRVFSEPSHTPLLVVVDREFAKSAEGESWLTEVFADSPTAAIVSTDLPTGRPSVQVPGRPEGDDRIAVWVRAAWPGGEVEELLVADARVGSSAFAFSSSLVLSESMAKGGTEIWEHCCICIGCEECITCKTPLFTCCCPGCETWCGWGGSCP